MHTPSVVRLQSSGNEADETHAFLRIRQEIEIPVPFKMCWRNAMANPIRRPAVRTVAQKSRTRCRHASPKDSPRLDSEGARELTNSRLQLAILAESGRSGLEPRAHAR
jgi:hypothetical protein